MRNSSSHRMSNWQQVVGYYSPMYIACERTPGTVEAWPTSKMSHTVELWSQYQAKAIQLVLNWMWTVKIGCGTCYCVDTMFSTSFYFQPILYRLLQQSVKNPPCVIRLKLQDFTPCRPASRQVLWNNVIRSCTSRAVPLLPSRACVK